MDGSGECAARAFARSLALFVGRMLFVGSALVAVPGHAQTCGAAGGDNRARTAGCQDGDVASHPAAEPATGTANSIDLVTGNKYLNARDAAWPGGLVFQRHYNSRHAFAKSLGPGWTHGYETALARVRVAQRSARGPAHELQVIQADGRRLVFRPMPRSPGRHQALDPAYGVIDEIREAGAPGAYLWRWADGRRLRFDADGRLVSVDKVNGDALALTYDPATGWLRRVANRAGIGLQFEYQGLPDGRGRLAALVQPDGSRIRLHYDAHGLLEQVVDAGGLATRYRYEDSATLHALTAVIGPGGQLEGMFRYDPQGRALYSARGAGAQAITLEVEPPARADGVGMTRVTASDGGVTEYRWRYLRHAHRAMILSAQGPGCAACPGTGYTRRYDALGRVVEQTDAQGRVRQWRYDAVGRLVVWRDRPGASPGRPSAAARAAMAADTRSLTLRYASDDPVAPLAVLASASIAPGREYALHWTHDARGRVTEVRETGFAPELSRLDRSLRPLAFRPITRVTRFAYVAGGAAEGRLAELDGPLPGPADRMRFDYDDRGALIAVQHPEGLIERREPDRAGREQARTDVAGVRTHILRDASGWPVRVEHGARVVEAAYDHAARAATLRERVGNAVAGALRIEWDDAGRITQLIDAAGHRLRWDRDAESRLIRLRVHPAASEAPVIDIDPRAPGSAAAGSSANTWAMPGASVRATGAGRIEWIDPAGARAVRLHDDFGQLVAESHPAHGVSVHRYDLAGRRVASAREYGGIELISRDALGRPLTQGTPAQPARTVFRYQGARLRAISDPARTVAWSLDAHGRELARAELIGPRAHGPDASRLFVTQTLRDPEGRAIGAVLPNGQRIEASLDPDGRARSMRLVGARPGAPERPLFEDARHLPFGPAARALTGYRAGNGVDVMIGRDRSGRIIGVTHSRPAGTARAPRGPDDAGGGSPARDAIDAAGAQSTALMGTDHQLPRLRIGYDPAGRITTIERNGHAEAYVYDALGRLTGAATRAVIEGYAYDAPGNRVARVAAPPRDIDAAMGAADTSARTLRSPATARSGWQVWRHRYDARGLPIRDAMPPPPSMPVHDGTGRRVMTLDLGNDSPAARDRRYFLFDGHRLNGEADADGRLSRWYIWIGERAVAMIDYETTPEGRIHWLHGDQIGLPWAATDASGQVRWSAAFTPFGERLPSASRGHIEVNLRLPGQYHDADTGLHDNVLRTYDPTLGRYLSPDPLGVAAGPNSYLYASADPLRLSDPMGLYDVDVHFYVTYFLARMAGIGYEEALTIASATQYVDDNPETTPVDIMSSGHLSRLRTYHFTGVDYDPPRLPGESDDAYRSRRVRNPWNPQLARLQDDWRSAKTPCAAAQLFGEFMHAFQDAFAHRDEDNVPIGLNGGLGHLFYGHEPDKTYDGQAPPVWSVRESRTLAMEMEVFARMTAYSGRAFVNPNTGQPIPASWKDLFGDETVPGDGWMQTFNRMQSPDEKILFLDDLLVSHGLSGIPIYDPNSAADRRRVNLPPS